MELHVSPDLDDCVGYGVGLIRVALRQIVVEALVVLLSPVQVHGQEKAQKSKYVTAPAGREVHVEVDGWMDGGVKKKSTARHVASRRPPV